MSPLFIREVEMIVLFLKSGASVMVPSTCIIDGWDCQCAALISTLALYFYSLHPVLILKYMDIVNRYTTPRAISQRLIYHIQHQPLRSPLSFQNLTSSIPSHPVFTLLAKIFWEILVLSVAKTSCFAVSRCAYPINKYSKSRSMSSSKVSSPALP